MSLARRGVTFGFLVGVASSLATAPARAEGPSKSRCADAYENAQKHERAGQINEAIVEATLCSSSACPEVLRADCTQWLPPLRARQSSIVVEARDASGGDVDAVRVTVDGVAVQERLDGRAFFVNPGSHTLVFEGPRGAEERRSVVIREGELARRVVVSFGAPAVASAPVTDERPRIPLASWVLGGVGVVGLGTFAIFGITGSSLEGELDRTCAPRCPDNRVDTVGTHYLVADIGLGVGLISLGVAAVLALTSR